VHVNNLSFKVLEDELRGICDSKFGEIVRIHLVKDDKGESKGFAFVEFKTEVILQPFLIYIKTDMQYRKEWRLQLRRKR
jgi:RNA recognition motif-containing protein